MIPEIPEFLRFWRDSAMMRMGAESRLFSRLVLLPSHVRAVRIRVRLLGNDIALRSVGTIIYGAYSTVSTT